MRAHGMPLPFSYHAFNDTLDRCDKLIKPYVTELVDKKNKSVKKAVRTIRFIGKEKEIEWLRKQISSHCQQLQLWLSFTQVLVSPCYNLFLGSTANDDVLQGAAT